MKGNKELCIYWKIDPEMILLDADEIRFLFGRKENTRFNSMKRTDDAITLWVFFLLSISLSVLLNDIKN